MTSTSRLENWFADATEQIVGNVSGAAVDDTAFRTSGIEIVSAADFDDDDYDEDEDEYDDDDDTLFGVSPDQLRFDGMDDAPPMSGPLPDEPVDSDALMEEVERFLRSQSED